MASDLRVRVTMETAIVTVLLALPAAWLAGASAGIGVLAAGVLTLSNFWWMSRAASKAADPGMARAQVAGFTLGAAARFALLFGAFAALCAGGYAHPVGVVVGLSVLPLAVIVQGLRSARSRD